MQKINHDIHEEKRQIGKEKANERREEELNAQDFSWVDNVVGGGKKNADDETISARQMAGRYFIQYLHY